MTSSEAALNDEELKPCPFCGGDKNTICKTDYDDWDAYAVSCRYPECHGAIFTLGYGYFPTKDQAIAAWNTRAVEPNSWIAEHKLFEAMLNEQAFVIREAALREVLDICKDFPYVVSMENTILALIGEKK